MRVKQKLPSNVDHDGHEDTIKDILLNKKDNSVKVIVGILILNKRWLEYDPI